MARDFSNTIFQLLHKTTINLFYKNNDLGVITGKIIQILTKNKFKIVKRDYLNNLSSRVTIKEEEVSFVIEPNEIVRPIKKEEKKLASLGYNIIQNGIIDSHSPFVMFNNVLYKQKYYTGHSEKEVGCKTKLVLQTTPDYAYLNFQKPTKKIEKGIFLGGSWPYNWYHWLIEILPKIELLKYLPEKYHTYPILVPHIIKDLKSHQSLLKKFFEKNIIIYLDDYCWHKVNEVIWIDSPTINSPSFRGYPKGFKLIDSNIHWEIMKSFQKRLITLIAQNKSDYKRIFLARKQEKRTYNQDEVYEMLKKYSFTAIYLEDLSISEQQSVIHGADFIAGPTGAAWSNLIFCKENTQALIWMPVVVKNVSIFANLAHLSNSSLVHYYFPCEAKSWAEFMHQEGTTVLDVNEIENIIIKMLDKKNNI